MDELESLGDVALTSSSCFWHIFGGVMVLVYVHLTILAIFIEVIDSLMGSVLP
jgi:hypothetical protein